ncbi:MAG: CapA family protein [Deltaproteobacteria bacterium]|nr:CapA family protein [Deltaproteobacteria bacterium]
MKNETKLVFTGDIGFDHYMNKKWEDPDLLSAGVIDLFKDADHVIVNLEGALVGPDAERVQSAEMRLMHTIDPAAVSVLRKIDARIWNLANNHMMDACAYGLQKTLEEAGRFGARTIGAGMNLDEAMRPLFFDEAGGIGLFAVGYRRGCKPADVDKAGCFLWNEMEKIRETVASIKKTCRWCVLVVHGGEEFTALPSPYTRDRYLQYLDMGVDVIVGHHPHVPMNYERIGNKAIFYSLGNFIFDTDYQRAQFHTEEGVILTLSFTENGWTFRADGIAVDRNCEQIVPAALPRIFVDIPKNEYALLSPLATKMFIAATKRQQIFLYPEKFRNATEEEWLEHFLNPKRSGRVIGEGLDFHILLEVVRKAEKGDWEKSSLTDIKNYILEQM